MSDALKSALFLLMITAQGAAAQDNAEAGLNDPSGCFQRSLVLTRTHLPNPGDAATGWLDIYTLDMESEDQMRSTRLTLGALDPSPYNNAAPALSPDGTQILFLSNRGAGPNSAYYLMSAQDSDLDGIGDDLGYVGEDDPALSAAQWLPDGRVFFAKSIGSGASGVFSAEMPQGAGQLVAIRRIGALRGEISAPQISPAGTHVLFSSRVADDAGKLSWHLSVLALKEGEAHVLSEDSTDGTAVWLGRGGDDIIFAREDGDLWRARLDLATGTPALADAERLARTPTRREHSPTISTDGRCLAFLSDDLRIDRGPRTDLYIRDLETGELHRITASHDIQQAVWRPVT